MSNILKENYINYLQTWKNIFFRADIHLIWGCNFKCVMCDNWKNEVVVNFEFTDLQKILLILKKEYNCNYVRLHWQEPTMYDKLEDLILFAKQIGLKVAIKTNAWLLSDVRLVKIIKYWLDELYLSIDWPDEKIHDKIRWVKGSFIKNINVIKKSRKINPELKIYINSVVMKSNYKYLPLMVDLWLKYKLDRVSFVFLNDKNTKNISGINLADDEFFNFFKKWILEIYNKSKKYNISVDFSPFISRFSGESVDFIIYELENNIEKYKNEIESFCMGDYWKYFYDKYWCFWPIDHSSINFNWDMFWCCVVERDRDNAVWNILKSDLATLWNTEKYIKYRENSNELCNYSNKCASNFYTRKNLFKSIYLDNNLYSLNNPINYYRYLKELKYEEVNILNDIKIKKLKNLLIYFYENVIFYKNLLEKNNISKEDIENISNLWFIEKLPVLDKGILKENILEIEKLSIWKKILKWSTSGNSGNILSFKYPLDFKRYIKQISIFSEESGFMFNDTFFSITPINCNQTIINKINEPEYVKKIYINILNFKYDKKIFLWIKEIFDNNSDVLFLHWDSKYILFIIEWFKKFKIDLPVLNGISISYSYTNKWLKQYIQKQFNCKIYDNYWCSEVWPVTIDNNWKKEIFGDNIIVNTINNELLFTDLDNMVFPFLNYKNWDLWTIEWNIIDLYGKKSQIINWKTLKDLDIFFYDNYPEIITYQINGNLLYIIWDSIIDIDKWKINTFLGKILKIIILENEFLRVWECSKFKIIN